jgi:hypothetical protein
MSFITLYPNIAHNDILLNEISPMLIVEKVYVFDLKF